MSRNSILVTDCCRTAKRGGRHLVRVRYLTARVLVRRYTSRPVALVGLGHNWTTPHTLIRETRSLT